MHFIDNLKTDVRISFLIKLIIGDRNIQSRYIFIYYVKVRPHIKLCINYITQQGFWKRIIR